MTRTKTRANANTPNNFVSILDFGAIADEDCTQAINDAITYAAANRVAILVPDGTYYTKGEHNVKGMSIYGNSPFSKLKLCGTTPGDVNTAKSMFIDQYSSIAELNNLWGTGGSLNLQNIHLEGNWDGSTAYTGSDGALTFDDITALIKFYGANENHFRNVRLTGNYGLGYATYMCGYSWFYEIWCQTNAMSAMHFESPNGNYGITSTSINDLRASSCRGYNSAHIYGGSGLTIVNGFNVKVYNCTNEDLEFSFRLLGGDNRSNYFVGNHSEKVSTDNGGFDFSGAGTNTYLVNNIFADGKVNINKDQFSKATAIGNYGLGDTGSAPTGSVSEYKVTDGISSADPKPTIIRTSRLSPGIYYVNAQINGTHSGGLGGTQGPFTFVLSTAGTDSNGNPNTNEEKTGLGYGDYGIQDIRYDEQVSNQLRLENFSMGGYLRVNDDQYIYLKGGPAGINDTLSAAMKTDFYINKVDSFPVQANVARSTELLPLNFDDQIEIMSREVYPAGYENEIEIT